MDPAALRRLDRVDTLVLDARLLALGPLVDRPHRHGRLGGRRRPQCAAQARSLLDPGDPTATPTHGLVALLPWMRDERGTRGTASHARRLADGRSQGAGALAWGRCCWRWWRVAEDPVPLAERVGGGGAGGRAWRSCWRGAPMRSPTGSVDRQRWTAVEHRRRDPMRTARRSRRHVRERPGPRRLRAADIGIGVETPGRRAPLGAHLVIAAGPGAGLDAARRRCDGPAG